MRYYPLWARVFVIASITVVCVLPTLCISLWLTISYVDAESEKPRALPPLYHNAQQAQQAEINDHSSSPWYELSFTTADSVEAVWSYYTAFMAQAGWRFWQDTGTGAYHRGLFDYSGYDGPTYQVWIEIRPEAAALTSVKLTTSSNGSPWDVSALLMASGGR